MTCTTCLGDGFYFDQGCMNETCAHGPRELSAREKKERKEAELPTIDAVPSSMPCPARPCSCSCESAKIAREKMKQRLSEQRERLKCYEFTREW